MEKYQNIHQDIINRCLTGDSKAQFDLYKLYYKAMYNTSLRIIRHTGDAEDIMQEAFMSAFQKLGGYKGDVSFGMWLKRIVVNKSIDYLKRQKNKTFISIDNEEFDLEDNEIDEFDFSGKKVEDVKNAIIKLPDNHRVILSLFFLEGYDHEEISEILGIANSSSRSQLTRAKQKLVKMLS